MLVTLEMKKYDKKYVATTHNTVISATEEKFNAPTEEAFGTLFDVEKLMVDKEHLAQSFKKWLSCCKCRRKLTDTICSAISIVKCGYCNTVQPISPISVCCVNASVRIAVRNKKSELRTSLCKNQTSWEMRIFSFLIVEKSRFIVGLY